MGFTNNDVKNFELYPEEATQKVLEQWGQRDGSTVDILISFLKEMKRDDCLQVLKQWDSLWFDSSLFIPFRPVVLGKRRNETLCGPK